MSVEILLVEDNPDDIELTLDALAQYNLQQRIFVARDGVEALDFLFARGPFEDRNMAETPRLILLDLKLPRVDGLAVLRRIKSDPRTRTTPVVVMTTSRDERDLMESYALGVNSYIVKPVDFEQFSASMRTIGEYWLQINEHPGTH